MRTLLYARFSNQYLQDAKSIADQISLLTEYCGRQDWEIVDIYTDHGIDGGAGIGEDQRPGMAAMLDRLAQNDIDQVFAESTDRIARHQGDSYAIRAKMEFHNCRLFVLGEGEIDEMKGTIKGLFDADFKKQLGRKVKRGMFGTVDDGRAPAGKAYGYRIANKLNEKGVLIRGLREIDDEQASVVVRIFTEIAAGRSAQAICETLNAEGVAGPTGGKWRHTTIVGDRKRQNGMLSNELYIGVRAYNRTSKVRDPLTRKTLIRPNPESEWRRQQVPDLRILDDELWQQVQRQRKIYVPRSLQSFNRPKRLFSGLTKCGCCGGGWIIVNRIYTGCGRHKDGGGCHNKARMRIDALDARILAGLAGQIMAPELVSEYVAEYHREQARWRKEAVKLRSQAEADLRRADERIARLIDALAEGGETFTEIRAALLQAKSQKERCEMQLADLGDDRVVELHPNLAEQYRRKWSDLQSALSGQAPDSEVAMRIRSMVDRVEITPPADGHGDLQIEIFGKLAEILAFASGTTAKRQCTMAVERVRGIEPL